jgi:Undecaprenyl-phosphate glucose phosphotransferase
MIKRHQKGLNAVSVLIEVLIFAFSYLLATYIRFQLMDGASEDISTVWTGQYVGASLLYGAVTVMIFGGGGLYTSMRTRAFGQIALKIILLNLIGMTLMTAFLYFTRIVDFSRISIVLFFILSCGLIIAKRLIVIALLHSYRRRGYNLKHVIVIGCGELAQQYARSVEKNPEWGFNIMGYIADAECGQGLGDHLGMLSRSDEILKSRSIEADQVIIALEAGELASLKGVIEACENHGLKASIIPYYNDYISVNASIDVIGRTKLIQIQEYPLDNIMNAFLKRAFDIVVSLLCIAVSSPVMLATVIGIKLSSPGPVIFRQDRIGYNNKPFTMYKFRSMRMNDAADTQWTTLDDPRKTRFGSFIRKTSIDELPQFVNVLKGDMSIVGPRPERDHFVEQFRTLIPKYMMKHRVKPGITGWAQINGFRGDTSIEGRIRHDLYYMENWSLSLDIQIVWKTLTGGMVNPERLK